MSLWEKLGLDNRDFNKSMDESKGKVSEFQEKTEEASETLDDMSKHGTKSVRELIKQMSSLDKSNRSVSNYRRQLGQLTRDIQDLTINYRSMSKEMQNSQIGREVVLKIQELTKEAANYKDSLMDAQASIKALASDTAPFDAAKQGIQAISGALQLVASAGVLGTENTEKLVKVIARLKAIESATNGIIALGKALQKESALMTGIRALQTKALAKAQLEEAAATEVAGAAQAKFNIIANSNPYILLASAAIAAIAGIVALSKALDDNAAKAEEAKKAAEEYSKSITGIVNATADSAYKFDELAKAFKNVKTEGEKQQFLKDYNKELQDLGLGFATVNDLETIFGQGSAAFKDACIKRAQAMALTQEIMEEYRKSIRAVMEAENILKNYKPGDRINEGDPAFDLLKQYGGYETYVTRLGDDYVIANDNFAETVTKNIQQNFENIKNRLTAEQDSLNDAYKGTVSSLEGFTKALNDATNKNNGGSNKKKDEAMAGSVAYLNQMISQAKTLKDQQVVGTAEWMKWQAILVELNRQLDEAIGKEKRLTVPKFEKIDPIDVPANLVIPNQVVPVELSPELKRDKLVDEFKKAQEEVSRIQGWLDLGLIGEQEAQKMVDSINKKLQGKGINLKLKLDFNQDEVETAVEAVSKLTEKYTKFGEVADSIISPINSVYESFKGLGEKLAESKNAWEQFFTIFQAGMTILESFSKVSQGIAAAMDLINTLQAAGIVAKKADTKATKENTRANLENAGSQAASAVAGATNSAAQTPVVGWALALVAAASVLAALMGAMSKAKGFAYGGIVPGSSFSGDNNLIRANSGEMVITSEQQKKLWDFISKEQKEENSNGLGGNVTFRISGSDLVGTLNNYTKKTSRL